ncbi:MAG: acetate/propionate family kinase [Nitrospirae bacterium]|uniref:acetate/propionate family kinase n=1 Tax=Candidatus Magnetobacterium casense TaxID=1455061 RepID=UPI0009DFCB9B|nr:acetate/propionate family kinase [Candidatus Magnetobacterium casensis]MBF0337142.1 acetate/propionate family kinase [Nitrospirota bacterium]
MDDLIEFLSGIEIFSDLSDDWLMHLSQASEFIEYKASERVISTRDLYRYLWIVYRGKVEISGINQENVPLFLTSLNAGDVLGELSVTFDKPVIDDITAAEDTSVIRLPRDVFSHIVAQNPSVLKKIACIATERQIQRGQHIPPRAGYRSRFTDNPDPYDLNFSSAKKQVKLLIINCGSSSLKYSLFDTSSPQPMFEGLIENIGAESSPHRLKTVTAKIQRSEVVKDIREAFSAMVNALTDKAIGVITDFSEIQAVGHRVVHGGDKFSGSAIISDEVKDAIRHCVALAPLHNPYNLTGIEVMADLLPNAVSVAVFDTAFHQSMPHQAYAYALPHQLAEERHVRRYGFHGTNHHFVALMASMFVKRHVGNLRIISCHLGNGASVCAIERGRSIDTSMGLTPLEGLVMGTRCGDIDPGLVLYLLQNGVSADNIEKTLNKESGLKGTSGISNDMREILKAADGGNYKAEIALRMFCYRVRKYIGAYLAALGGVDILLFTGGIGENSSEIRARICQGLDSFGIILDTESNRMAKVQRGNIADISTEASRIRILVVAADEERMIAREIIRTVDALRA